MSFSSRHIGILSNDLPSMLKEISSSSLTNLIQQALPSQINLQNPLNLSEALSESECLEIISNISKKNIIYRSFIGKGYYDCFVPTVIQRNILENPGWYTQYTPYQAEISQGRLEALLNFQTMVIDLTQMDIANSSLLDEGTAAAEAMFLAWNISQKKKKQASTFLVSKNCYSQTINVIQTRSEPLNIEVCFWDEKKTPLSELNHNTIFGLFLQYPDQQGQILNYSNLTQTAKDNDIIVCVAADLLSLTILKPPGEWGADIVIGTTQRFGAPMGYGGPHAAYFATKSEYKRLIPGRIIGVSTDKYNKPALRMALQTREQHIRREKATSNICTAQVLLAIMSSFYACYHGPKGLKAIAQKIQNLTVCLHNHLTENGFKQINKHFFDTLTIHLDSKERCNQIQERAIQKGLNFHYPKDNHSVSIAFDETKTQKDIEDIITIFTGKTLKTTITDSFIIPEDLKRNSTFLEHPNFNNYHSETEMLRYIHYLEKKDLSLNHSMIALGSCTMKLNGTTEMIPVTWDNWSKIHPFAPLSQAQGYQQIFLELEESLNEITGLKATSLQPNSGAQGEYAGLLVIRKYHKNRNDSKRNIVLIPSSAHGTNPASASLNGLKIIIIKCDNEGNIDIQDLKEKSEQHQKKLCAFMITYPSTHGIFEEEIQQMSDIIHSNGGLVYMDGANMNAQVGLTNPGRIGIDVCHLNLHKTFCIPHGGGGPGVGPICVNDKLINFLPTHSFTPTGGQDGISAVSSAPWGSANILLISWAYIKLMGEKGLSQSTRIAILNANYLMSKLEKHYPILYTNKNNRVAHEFIIDFRPFKNSAGIEIEDVAKRLMDYGFHAPTVSFPIVGTLMIEPTESESKKELDRFCEAMISIRKEIKQIEDGIISKEDNPLKNAPHTQEVLIQENWPHSYSRKEAVFPTSWSLNNKFWPTVGRIDSAKGDKQLICTCPPIENWQN